MATYNKPLFKLPKKIKNKFFGLRPYYIIKDY